MPPRSKRRRRHACAGALAATLALAVPAGAASTAVPAGAASTVEVDGGRTTLQVAARTAARFQRLDVGVGVAAPARTRRSDSAFPIVGGRIDPATARGRLRHAGRVAFVRGADRVVLRSLQLRVGAASRLSARVGARRVDMLALAVRRVAREGFGTVVRPVRARVTRPGARVVNRALGVRALRPGQVLGRVGFRVVPAQIALTGGTTTLAVAPAFHALLARRGAQLQPAPPAAAGAAGAVVLPVAGGTLDVTTAAGTIEHGGGLRIVAARIERAAFTAPTLTFADTPQLGATYAGAPVVLAELAVDGEPAIDPAARTVTARIAAARLTAAGARVLGDLLPGAGSRAGLDVGSATLAARAR